MMGIAFLVGFFLGGFSLIMLVYRAIQALMPHRPGKLRLAPARAAGWRGWSIRSGRSPSTGTAQRS
jgi:hypothetical protein